MKCFPGHFHAEPAATVQVDQPAGLDLQAGLLLDLPNDRLRELLALDRVTGGQAPGRSDEPPEVLALLRNEELRAATLVEFPLQPALAEGT